MSNLDGIMSFDMVCLSQFALAAGTRAQGLPKDVATATLNVQLAGKSVDAGRVLSIFGQCSDPGMPAALSRWMFESSNNHAALPTVRTRSKHILASCRFIVIATPEDVGVDVPELLREDLSTDLGRTP